MPTENPSSASTSASSRPDWKATIESGGEKLKEQAQQQAERQKDHAAQSFHMFAEAIRTAADELESEDQTYAAGLVQGAARQLEWLSRSLDSHSVADMAQSASSYARQRPYMFVAGGLAAGIVLGRFIGASADRQRNGSSDQSGARPRNDQRPQGGERRKTGLDQSFAGGVKASGGTSTAPGPGTRATPAPALGHADPTAQSMDLMGGSNAKP